MKDALQTPADPPQLSPVEANLFAQFASFAGWSHIEVHDEPDCLWTISDIPCPFFNSVARINLPPDRVDDAIEAAIGRYEARHVPMMWWTGPSTQPPDLSTHLAAHGFQGEALRGMAVRPDALPQLPPRPPGLVVEQVTDLDSLAAYCDIFCACHEMPDFRDDFFDLFRYLGPAQDRPWRHYLGWLESEPVATSALGLLAGVAGIYNIATLPNVRRRGIGAAMTAAALLEACAEDRQVAVLGAAEMGVDMYRNLGFQDLGQIGQFIWRG